MEEDEVSKEYLKAYNHADMICNYMPEQLEHIFVPEGENPEYTKGFKDRIRQHEIEKDALKGFSVEELRVKYGKDLDNYNKEREINSKDNLEKE